MGFVQLDDPSVSLQAMGSGLGWPVQNGTFELHVVDQATGQRSTHLVTVDPQNDSLEDVVDRINVDLGIPDVTALVGPDGQFMLRAATGREIAFSEDTSGFLAAMGVNGFFTGTDATSLAVDQDLLDDPALLSTSDDFTPGGNGAALAMVVQSGSPEVLFRAKALMTHRNKDVRVAATFVVAQYEDI